MQNLQLGLNRRFDSVVNEIPNIVETHLKVQLDALVNKAKMPQVESQEAESTTASQSNSTNHSTASLNSSKRSVSNLSLTSIPSRSRPNRADFNRRFKEIRRFDGRLGKPECRHPKDFLEEVTYCFDTHDIDDEDRVKEVGRLLDGDANTWYQVYRNQCKTFSQFSTEFLKYFWGRQRQLEVRANLFTPSQYRPNLGSMSAYFLNLLNQASHLDHKIPVPVIISALLEHFPHDVKWSLAQVDLESTEAVIFKLQSLDNLSAQKSVVFPQSQVSRPNVQRGNTVHQVELNGSQQNNSFTNDSQINFQEPKN